MRGIKSSAGPGGCGGAKKVPGCSARDQRGFALIMSLWVMVFLTVVAMSFTLTAKWSLAGTANYRNEAEAYYLALSGYDMAVNYLINDSDTTIDFTDEEGNFYCDKKHEPLIGKIPLYNGEVEIKITDESSRLNINKVSPDILQKLFNYAGIEPDLQSTLIDSLQDWIDPDDMHRLNGAESDYYKEFGYPSKNGILDTVEELLLIKGFNEDILYGSDKYKAVYPLLTAFGTGTLNVNTISPDLMRVLGVPEVDIENLMSYRNKESGGLMTVPPNLYQYNITATASNDLRIEVTAEAKQSGIKYVITAVVKRVQSAKGYSIKTVFWREHAQYS